MSQQDDNSRLFAAAVSRLKTLQLGTCFDPRVPDSRPTSDQQAILDDLGKVPHRYVVAANQAGKSQLGGRESSWIFNENHPFWKRPDNWVGPLTLLVISRTGTIVEQEIWEKKIRPFLASGEYKEHRNGGNLYKVTNTKNGNIILFFSHHSPEEAREKLQGFTAHYVWLDEMPNSLKLIEELHRRIQANNGYFIATFTPKIPNKDIQRLVDTTSTIQKRYKLMMLGNPVYKGREAEIMESMKTLPENYRNAILYGTWYSGDSAVYEFLPHHIQEPQNYHPSWRHVEAIDPASSGKTGLLLLAECPASHVWFVVKASYISEPVPSRLIERVAAEVRGYNIAKRVADSHESWYVAQAGQMGYRYGGVFKKNERKKELIKNLQERLHVGRVKIAPWCEDLIDEFNTCQWHESIDGKIVGASRFHLLDALQYGVDVLPKPQTTAVPASFDQALKQANRQRKEREAKKAVVGRLPRARLKARRGRKVRIG